jgi:hypothetical protein
MGGRRSSGYSGVKTQKQVLHSAERRSVQDDSAFSVLGVFGSLNDKEFAPVDLHSPFVVVPVIAIVFLACILFSTSTKEDGHESH